MPMYCDPQHRWLQKPQVCLSHCGSALVTESAGTWKVSGAKMQRENLGGKDAHHPVFSQRWAFLRMRSDLLSDSVGDAAITSFHLLISFILLSLIVSLSFISVIRSSMGRPVCVPSPSASKERKRGGDRPEKYNDDKHTDGSHLIDLVRVFPDDVLDVKDGCWDMRLPKKNNSKLKK